ncbi:DUF4153 domain-containing protein [Aliidiomarina indica]|uniref:DUF4153 domain-containing protein n=1 Tax=Aliidiomarina indica TaxID=2749147 RepID=UPI00188F433A|nr:DUF4153 domain-containing protein [Aliidiomarina indica]
MESNYVNTNQSETTVLARPERFTLVTVGVVQAIVLYLLLKGVEHGWLSLLVSQVTLFTLVLIVPTAFMLSLRALSDRLFWQHMGLLSIVFVPLAWFAARLVTTEYFLPADHVLSAFAFVMFLTAFTSLPFLQSRLQWRSFRLDYPSLFKHAWQNALTLALAFFFILISWGLLMLWAVLFELINISFFYDLFTAEAFMAAITGFLFGMGILIGRTQERTIQTSRKLIFALCTGLLPVAAFVLLIFLATLPFVGFSALWYGDGDSGARVSMAVTLSVLIVFLIVLFNAVFQLGDEPLPYPRAVNWLVRAALALSPVLGVLALAAVWVRIGDYGWTAERYWALIAVLLLALYSIGYSASCWLRNSNGWTWIPRINMGMALLGMLIAALSFTPVLNPYRMAANSQAERFEADVAHTLAEDAETDARIELEFRLEERLEWFRFSAGVHGIRVLERWRDDETYAPFHERIEQLLARTRRYERHTPGNIYGERGRQALALQIHGPAPGVELDPDLLRVVSDDAMNERCFDADIECIGNGIALLQTETGELIANSGFLLCRLDRGIEGASCSVYGLLGQEQNEWQHVQSLWFSGSENVKEHIRNGTIQMRMPCMRVLEIDGQRRAFGNFSCY